MRPGAWLSVQQMLVDPVGAPGNPRAAFGVAPSDVALLPMHTVTEFSHWTEDQARLEKQLQKLKAQVTPPCCPLTHPRTPPKLSQAQTPRPCSSLPCLATPALVPTEGIW